MEPWVGAVTGNVEFPAVFANENYRIALSQLTPSTFGFGNMALQNSNAVSITGGNVAVTALSGAITIANGGTGLGDTPTNGQLLIGTGSGYALANLTAGSGISITNSSGGVTIAASGAGFGTVTSVDVSGGATGLIFSGGPVTTTGVITMSGTLGVSNGGTGGTTATLARANLSAAKSGANSDITSITGLTTPLSVLQGGTGANESLSGYIFGNGMNPFTSVATIPMSDLTGTLPISKGGTNATTAVGARASILPDYTSNANKGLFVNVGATDVEWRTMPGSGTVTSIDVSGGSTGLTTTGGPVTIGGTITLAGTLAVASGGTGATIAGTARTNLGAAASGANTDITSIALTTGTISASPVNGTDIVNKLYADSIASGINFHQSVRLATAAALPANTYNNGTGGVGATLTANANGALSVDGVAVVVGNRILVKNEVAQANNGVYTVTQVGDGSTPYILTRATDFDSSGSGVDQIDAGDFFLVTAGSTQANTSWVQQTPLPITVGTTAIVFSQFAAPVLYNAGTGLTLAGTVFSITNTGVSASTYGSASSVPVLAINAQGQVTSASSSSIAIAASQVTSGTFTVAQGGTGATTLGANGVLLGNGTSAISATAVGATGQVLVGNTGAAPTWATLSGIGVTSFSAGTTGLTPASATTGAITLGGTLAVANGGTGVTTATGTGSVVLSNSPTLVTPTLGAASATSIANGLGAVGTPSYTFTGDLNTGMWSPAADTIAFGTNATERVRIDSSGLIMTGIIQVTRATYGALVINSDSIQGQFAANGSGGTVDIRAVTNHPMTFLTNNTERMRITSAGDIGIGTSSPAYKLVVGGASGATTTPTALSMDATYTPSPAWDQLKFYLYKNATDSYGLGLGIEADVQYWAGSTNAGMHKFFTRQTERMRLDSLGNLGIGTAAPSQRVSVGSTGGTIGYGIEFSPTDQEVFALTANTATGEVRHFAFTNYFPTFYSNNTERMRITSAGNVGINESAPDYKLDVNGTFGFTPGASVTPVDNGDVVFELTNNTTLTIKAKGSDGVVRSGTITLA
jgi:hypothetical protein